MTIRERIVGYISSNGGTHTNASLAAALFIPEPSVRRATREAGLLGEIRGEVGRFGYALYSPVPVPAPSEPTAPTLQ